MESTVIATVKATRIDMLKVPASLINVDATRNLREDLGDMDSLKSYILKNGTAKLPPIMVRKNGDKYDLIHGYRRMTAINELEAAGATLQPIKAIPVSKEYTEMDELYDHFAQNGGKELTPWEQAKGFKQLEEAGESRKDIAGKAGVTEAHVCNMLKITSVSAEVKEAITKGLVASTLVLNTMNKYGEEADGLILKAIDVAKDSGKVKATNKDVEKSAGASNGSRVSSTMKALNKTIDFVTSVGTPTKEEMDKFNKVSAILAILDTEKSASVIAEKLLELM